MSDKELQSIADHYLYFTSQCIVEAMHIHASDKKLTESYSAKFFVRADGSSVLQDRGKEIQMLYPRFTHKGINMIIKAQESDLERSFVCKFETGIRSVRHVS
jgi:hypothetical protein